MKPNDKAIEAARAAILKAMAERNCIIAGVPFNENNYDEFDASEAAEHAKVALDAAYAAQFQSEDYAGLVERLRSQNELYVEKCVGTHDVDENKIEPLCNEAADALEAVLAERDTVRKELIDEIKRLDRERIAWKKQQEETAALLKQVEAERDAAIAAQFQSEDYAGLINWLRDSNRHCSTDGPVAADALEALLAEREVWKGRQKDTATILKQVEDERDALKAANNELREENELVGKQMDKFADQIESLETERDALAAHLAPVEAIENDKDDPTREYIPLPGGWEIQTKGKGSSYRLLDTKTGERHMILAGDEPFVQEFVTRMAKEINASAQVRPVAPVDDEELVEIVAKVLQGGYELEWSVLPEEWKKDWLRDARVAIAAIRPHIEAAERERCAKIAEARLRTVIDLPDGYINGWEQCQRSIAAAIRSGK